MGDDFVIHYLKKTEDRSRESEVDYSYLILVLKATSMFIKLKAYS